MGLDPNIKVGKDVAKKLGITKYTPPKGKMPSVMKARKKKHRNPDFKMYTSISHIKYYPEALEDIDVMVTEKVHGTNFRSGWVKWNSYNLNKKILALLVQPFVYCKHEFAYGSHRVELTNKGKRSTGFYKENVYYKMTEKYNLKEVLPKGYVIYAEIYGWNIQKGYFYGLKDLEWDMVVVDVMKDGKYLDGQSYLGFCVDHDLPTPPVLYIGAFDYEKINKLANLNRSVLCPEQKKPIEGIVVKAMVEGKRWNLGRLILKWINDEYWLNKNNSDWH